MLMSKLDKTDANVSRLGFGAMRLPLLKNGKIDRVKAAGMVDLAYRSGVNYYDTAYGYHNGESEIFLGEALKGYPRESFYIADKLPLFFCEKEADVERIFLEQMERLKVDYFDFYLFHALSKNLWEKALKFKAMDKMLQKKAEGKIKRLGFSYHGDYDTFIEILDYYDWEFVQIQYNYIDEVKLDAKAYYDELEKRGIPCIVMEPVRGGFLAELPREALDEMGKTDNADSARLALRWVLSKKNTPVILSGMSSLSQVESNIKIFEAPTPLAPYEYALLEKARDVILKLKTVPCTGCAYCMDCPSGVDIPANLRIYNEFKLFRNSFGFINDYEALGKRAGKGCTSCGKCLPLCPQGIDIPHWLRVVGEENKAAKL